MNPKNSKKNFYHYTFIVLMLTGLYFTTCINYLLFHSLAEIFSIVIAFSFFLIAWNSRNFIKNQYLLFIGIAYLFIAFLDLMHTLAYKGMPIFTDYDYYANQLWIGARYLESITLLAAFYFLGSDKKLKPDLVFALYMLVTSALILSIFYWKIFPVCFVEGLGLTVFKKVSEYIICVFLICSIALLYKNKTRFDSNIFFILLLSFFFTILSELAFTFYISNYGFSNLVGHYFKILSFYLIYKAIIETGVKHPYEIIFRELDTANRSLKDEIECRKKSEQEKEKLLGELKTALSEVKTLRGILPICSFCKQIRDDKGYWNQIESYIQNHSEADFSHGVCPDCMKKHYPDIDMKDDQDK